MKNYFVYILQCSDDSYYTGVTNNVERRLYEHQNGLIDNCYTHGRRPIKLVCVEVFNDIVRAIAREKQIKGWKRVKKQALIKKSYESLPKLSLNSVKAKNYLKIKLFFSAEIVIGGRPSTSSG
jgi:putative endonuclease